jgi:hypothetical protein
MHALIATFQMDPTQLDANAAELRERIIPLVKHQPGFRAGYWTHDPSSAKYVSFIAFDTEEQARGLLAYMESDRPRERAASVQLESAAIVVVAGTAAA